MVPMNRHVKRLALGVAMAGGVATGMVTAASATSSSTALHENPTAAQAQQVHQEVVALTEREEGLKTEVLQREQQQWLAAETASTAGSSAVNSAPVAPQQTDQPAPKSTGSRSSSPVSSLGHPIETAPTDTPSPAPPASSTTEPPESTTTTVVPAPPVTSTTLANGGGWSDGGD